MRSTALCCVATAEAVLGRTAARSICQVGAALSRCCDTLTHTDLLAHRLRKPKRKSILKMAQLLERLTLCWAATGGFCICTTRVGDAAVVTVCPLWASLAPLSLFGSLLAPFGSRTAKFHGQPSMQHPCNIHATSMQQSMQQLAGGRGERFGRVFF